MVKKRIANCNYNWGKRIYSFLLCMILAFSLAGCGGNDWEGPELEQQLLGTESIDNARQLGGYPAADGKHVKDDVLIRSGMLFEASQPDLDKLKDEYGLKVIVDLRTSEEAAASPDPEMEGVEYYHLPLMEEEGDSNQAAIVEIYRLYGNDPGRAYVEMVRAGALSDDLYTCFIDSEEALESWRSFFDILLEHEDGAVLWHCTGGKDRAGMTTVLLLSALGVDEETILADFALTNEVNSEKISYITAEAEKHTSDPDELEQVAALVGVSTPHMQMVFDRAEEEWGSMQAFIQDKIGLTDKEIATLREKYLE